ncbi:MAG: hypothetical protein EOO77_15625 [Oxalobacteraceae bacterium]|nr:MAG: hypothetical protein EOO77_15625 [Oxalobacteraceae bacterium]
MPPGGYCASCPLKQ